MNLPIFIISIAFFFAQNSHFGWHAFAQSDAELIADGINLLLTALAFLRWRVAP